MLTYAYKLAKFRDGESPLAAGEDLFEFLLEIFVKQIDQLVRQGIYRGYIDFEDDRPYLRGRLMLAQQLRMNAAQMTRFQQRTNELTADLRENWILKFTLWQLSRMGFDNPDLRRRFAADFVGIFGSVVNGRWSGRLRPYCLFEIERRL